MTEKEHGFMDTVKGGISHIFQSISANIFHPIADGAETVMKNIDSKVKLIERRIFKKVSHHVIIGFGAILIILALFFFLKDYLGWSNTAAFFCIGIIIVVIGLVLKIRESDK